MSTYTPLQSIQLSAAASTVTFYNINQSYQDLVIIVNALGNVGYSTDYGIGLRLNGDSGTNYSDTWLYGNGSSAISSRRTNATLIQDIQGAGYLSTTTPNPCIIHLFNYSNTTTNKVVFSRSNNPTGGSGTASIESCVGTYRLTPAITSVTIVCQSGSFGSGSTFDLYGLSPVAAQNASAAGGTDVFYDSTYVYHVFKGSGTFTPYRALSADLLVVAGGGAGGSPDGWYGGGGGAGGLQAFTSQSLTANTAYTVTVGAGGPGSTTLGGTNGGNSGSNSQFGSLTASVGGGGGGNTQNAAGSNGGSGGGGVRNSGAGGTATSGQGNNGGAASTTGGGGGGGGAGAVGGIGTTSSPTNYGGGPGGAGSSTYSSWGSVTNTGENVSGTYYYAGGGGGCGTNNIAVAGGSGGGGQGAGWQSANTSATSGITNTGGGGGGVVGGATSTPNGMSGSGGSGIVIVRYTR